MRALAQNEPLTDAEFDHLAGFLKNCKGSRVMNLEELDGLFSALIAGPEIVMPSEYMPEVFGSETSETHAFESLEEANEILGLLMRHWNSIAGTLSKGDIYLPLLLEDENGMEHGNDWARGFIRGSHLRHDGWAELLADDDHGGSMIPMMILYHEHDEDPAMRPNPINPEQREKLIESMAAGLMEAYRYFRRQVKLGVGSHKHYPRHTTNKIERNNPCPCGSGKKYKHCCGGLPIN